MDSGGKPMMALVKETYSVLPPAPPEIFNILVVDDVKDNLLALGAVVARPDVRVHQALSGESALELMMQHDFCLAILDVRMPTMSGFELAELMRGSKRTKNIPIIFVTAAKQQSFSFKGYESGAVDFLLKPLDTQAVQSKVNIFIELHRQKLELKTQLQLITNLMERLKESKTEAEEANFSKSQFLANMSHEIRTPIGAILGFTDLMKNAANTVAETRSYMNVVDRNSQQLLRLIDDILDLSKVEAGMMATEKIEFSLPEVLSDFNSVMTFKARESGIEFRLVLESSIPEMICSDPARIRQILNNVVGNALKFTSRGSVVLSVQWASPNLTFSIRDTGVGISKEQEARLFKPFSQADISTTRKFGGTGLGLALSRRLAETLDGTLQLSTSSEGAGSTFVFQMRSELIANTMLVGAESLDANLHIHSPTKETALSLGGMKILLVEDSPDNQVLINMYLSKVGASVTIASNGAEGVKRALAEDFDVVLMDIQMPVLDGHDATKKLRSTNYSKPIIALTAHAMKAEQDKCFASGFSEFLTKPIEKKRLINLLLGYRT